MTPVQTTDTGTSTTSTPQSISDWYGKNRTLVNIAATLVAVAAAGVWFYMRSAEIKRANAERVLGQAKQSLSAGNVPLAMTDLQRVADRYKSTPAGIQAAMLLAQLNFEQGKFAEGIQVLDRVRSEADAGAGAVLSLMGDGQFALGKADDAVASYRRAAEAASGPGERAQYLAKAGRVLMSAGKNAEAKAIWEQLAADPEAATVHSEARVRLGELAAQPAGKT